MFKEILQEWVEFILFVLGFFYTLFAMGLTALSFMATLLALFIDASQAWKGALGFGAGCLMCLPIVYVIYRRS